MYMGTHPPGGLIPFRCDVTVIVVQHNGRLDVVVQNCGHLREGKVGFLKSRNLRIHCLKSFSGFSTALDWTVTSCTWPRHATQPCRASPQGHISVMCAFGAVGGTNLRLGGGPPPDPRKYVFMYLLVYILSTPTVGLFQI